MRVLTAGALYFALVFAVAFALGTVRTLLLEPAFGETWAVACEIPFLVIAMFFAARFMLQRYPTLRAPLQLLAVGAVALVFQEAAEMALVMLSGETLAMHVAYLQTLAGRLYLAALAAFLVMPFLLRRHA